MTKKPAKTAPVSAQGSRKGNSSGKKAGKPWVVIFWLGFIILFICLFLFNREAIRNSIEAIKNEISPNRSGQKPLGDTVAGSEEPESPPSTTTEIKVNPPPETSRPGSSSETQTQQQKPSPAPPAQAPSQTTPQTAPQINTPAVQQTTQPAAQRPSQTPQAAAPESTQTQTELRERALYFIHVDRGGSIIREKVNRKIPVSDSPMTDAIQAIIAGPTSEEKSKGLISLIPQNTKILSATVRGDTAYISFSEDFQYNTYGVEGYASQLRQVVFTATEFPNIKNVQILIEGRRLDYLGEGIWIGSPLNRDML